MSSDTRAVDGSTEHTGSRDRGPVTSEGDAVPSADVVATPIYDELAARFDLPRRREGERLRTGSTDVGPSPAAKTGEVPASMRPAC